MRWVAESLGTMRSVVDEPTIVNCLARLTRLCLFTMKIAVAGATGYVGEVTVAALPNLGHQRVAIVRRGSPTVFGALRTQQAATPSAGDTAGAAREMLSAEIAVVDWDDPESVAASVHGCDAIIQTIGTTRAQFKYGASYEKIDYGTTIALLKAAKTSGCQRFVLLSSVGAAEQGVEYLKWKWRTEKAVQDSGIPYAIVRPSFIAGPGRAINKFLDLPLAAVGLFARQVAQRYRSIHRDQLARVLIEAAVRPDAAGRIFEGESLWALLS